MTYKQAVYRAIGEEMRNNPVYLQNLRDNANIAIAAWPKDLTGLSLYKLEALRELAEELLDKITH